METQNESEPVVEQPKSSRSDLWTMIIVAAMAFVLFIAPQINTAVANLAAGSSVVPITGRAGGEPIESFDGAAVDRIDLVATLADQSGVVATLLVLADVLAPILWTVVLLLMALLAFKAMRGRLFSVAFGRQTGWLAGVALAAAYVPGAFRYMGTNGVIAQLGQDEMVPGAFNDSWIVLVLVTALTLVLVMHRSGRRLAEDQAGTV